MKTAAGVPMLMQLLSSWASQHCKVWICTFSERRKTVAVTIAWMSPERIRPAKPRQPRNGEDRDLEPSSVTLLDRQGHRSRIHQARMVSVAPHHALNQQHLIVQRPA